MQKIQFDYFRGMEAEQYSFYRVPKVLFTAECFKSLSCEAKVLYGLMLDRMSLSIKNRWFDEEDRVYIIFTVEEIMELLGCGRQKAIKNIAELDTEKGIGLIEKKRLGLGKPNVIYVKNFMIMDCPEQKPKEKQPENTVNANHPKSAVLAGGGFIGLELAENLRELGMDVTIVQRPKQLMNPFDADMASFIHNEMRKHGVKLALGHTVEGFEERDGGVDVLLKDEQPLHADMVILAIGVSPETTLAKDAGLELGIKGSIVVNDRMETSISDIYAVGDAVQVKHFVTGQDALISLAGPANKQGRIAADNICGGDSHYTGSQGSSVIKIFGMTAATTGVNETNARKTGLDVDTVILSPMSHAGYYPGGKVMTMKVVFEKATYRLLGAQIVGYEGVDKRIDVLATAIRAGMKATELKDLDLAYAPPYSSAKDPVNMAGFMVENIANGVLKQWHLEDADRLPRDGSVTLLDTRTVEEFAHGHIDGFFNIPVDELRERLGELDKRKPVYVICQSGLRSYIACRILAGNGFDCYNFSGGFRFYDAVTNDRCLIESATACGMDRA